MGPGTTAARHDRGNGGRRNCGTCSRLQPHLPQPRQVQQTKKKHSTYRAASRPTDVTALRSCSTRRGGHPQRKGAF
ncbi:hypothetical protein SVAN01_02247 [Stagonosporopsis vannaccii]|nr:hypothetical protein SVAN01_02247 [Stagonosporopsis vannaccii]